MHFMSTDVDVTTRERTSNPYLTFLGFGGLVLAVLGAIIGFASKANGDQQHMVALFASSLVGGIYDDSSAQQAYGWAWFGVALAVLGIIMMIAWVVIRAARR